MVKYEPLKKSFMGDLSLVCLLGHRISACKSLWKTTRKQIPHCWFKKEKPVAKLNSIANKESHGPSMSSLTTAVLYEKWKHYTDVPSYNFLDKWTIFKWLLKRYWPPQAQTYLLYVFPGPRFQPILPCTQLQINFDIQIISCIKCTEWHNYTALSFTKPIEGSP